MEIDFTSDLPNKHERRINPRWLSVILFSVMWAVIVLWPHLSDWYRVPIDGQNFYWMAKFQDPALFPDDRLQYFDRFLEIEAGGRYILLYPASLGYTFLFYLASFVISPIVFAKSLVFFLLPLTVHYLYRLGEALKDPETGSTMGLLFCFFTLASPDSISVAGGLQRSFAIPLVLIFLYFMVTGALRKAGFMVFLSTLFYLPVFPLLLLTYGFHFLRFNRDGFPVRIQISRSHLSMISIVIIFSFIIAGWAIVNQFNLQDTSGLASIQKDTPIKENPLNQEGGPVPMYLRFPWLGKAGLFDVDADALNALLLISMCILSVALISKREIVKLPGIAWKMLASGLVMYGLSLFTLFYFSSTVLYLPSRYTRTVLFVVPFIFASANYPGMIKKLPHYWKKYKWCISGLVLGLLAVLIVYLNLEKPIGIILGWMGLYLVGMITVILPGISFYQTRKENLAGEGGWGGRTLTISVMILSLLPMFAYSRLVGYDTINPTADERKLYKEISTLPKDVVIAGSPEELTAIPLFAKRSVLFRDLFPHESAPIVDNFQAYYADDPGDVLGFCQGYGVDYLVFNREDYSKEYIRTGAFFFEPYNSSIQEKVHVREGYALLEADAEFTANALGFVKCVPSAFE